MITGATRVYGLVGHPFRHSLSPAMHNELFRRCGVDAVYVTFDVAPERAEEVVPAIRALALAGVNLTVPFKERVLPQLDVLGDDARLAGAVNVTVAPAAGLPRESSTATCRGLKKLVPGAVRCGVPAKA